MRFPANSYLLAFAGAFLTSWLSLPLWARLCRRVGLVDDPGIRKIHQTTTPLAGGLAMFTGLVIPVLAGLILVWMSSGNQFARESLDVLNGGKLQPEELLLYGFKRRYIQLFGLLAGGAGMLLLGLWDDLKELKPASKFIGQIFFALVVAASGVRITLFVSNTFFSFAVTILWIVTTVNAFNFMDNMNGLCAGLCVLGAAVFGFVAAGRGEYLVAATAFLTCGAALGFLLHNFPRAKAFLGDAGSHLVGYMLAVLAILPHFYSSHFGRREAVVIPLFVLAVPLGDLCSVVIVRWKKGQPFYRGDTTSHLSHRLVARGMTRTRAVLIIWFLAAIIGSLALLW